MIKGCIVELFDEFHEFGYLIRCLNSIFPMFILKVEGVTSIKDFIPISFVGSIYKLIFKVLARRITKVIGGWSMSVNMLLWRVDRSWMRFLLQMKSWMNNTRIFEGIFCKPDIKKTYDHIN